MRTRGGTTRLRTAAHGTALLTGAALATALGWSAWVETDAVTGATVAAPPAAGALSPRPVALRARQSAVWLCQATGDGAYVRVSVLPERLTEYRRNPNNIVPAPAGGCPVSVGVGLEPPPTTAAPAPPPVAAPVPAAPAPAPAPPARTPPPVESTPPAPATQPVPAPRATPPAEIGEPATAPTSPQGAVKAVTASGGATVRRASTATGPVPATLAQLPNTGNETALLLFLGADLLLLGAGLRLRARPA